MATTEPDEVTYAVVGTGSAGKYVMLVSASWHEKINVILQAFADTVTSARSYSDDFDPIKLARDEDIFLPDKPSQIQKTTAMGLVRYGQRFRGKATRAKTARVRKIPGHQDRLRNKRKRWIQSLRE
jgi:hypothetical protein